MIRQLFQRSSVHLGSLGREPRNGARLRNERFASYLAANNRRSINTDRQDALLAGRRFFRGALMLGLVCLAAWIVVESASAIGVF